LTKFEWYILTYYNFSAARSKLNSAGDARIKWIREGDGIWAHACDFKTQAFVSKKVDDEIFYGS